MEPREPMDEIKLSNMCEILRDRKWRWRHKSISLKISKNSNFDENWNLKALYSLKGTCDHNVEENISYVDIKRGNYIQNR